MSEELGTASLLAERERLTEALRESAKAQRRIKGQLSLLNKLIALQDDETIIPRKSRAKKSSNNKLKMVTIRGGGGYRCPTCGFTSARSQGMAAHLRVHKGEA